MCRFHKCSRLTLLFTICFVIASFMTKRLKQQEETFSKEVVIPLDSFLILNSFIHEDTCHYQYHIVSFYDSTECYSCLMRHFSEMNERIMEYKRKYSLDYIVIMEISSERLTQRRKEFLRSQFESPFYIDTANVFRKCNPLFSQDYDRQLHNFVINKDNKVVMIGNPLKSYKLEETLRKLIDGRSSY